MFTHSGTQIVPLTRKYVDWFAKLPTYKGDRDLTKPASQARIRWLANLLSAGTFHTPKWATAKLGGIIYRVNGGHSSKMLAESNGEFPVSMMVVVDEFLCESPEDIAELFSHFDSRRSLRSSNDKIIAHKAVHESLNDVPPTTIRNAIAGIACVMSECGDEAALDEESRIRLIHQHQDFILWMQPYGGCRHLRRQGTCGAIYATFCKAEADATEFWNMVRDENHPDNRNPTRVLAGFLKSTIGGTSSRQNAKWDTRAYYVKCIHAWNAYRGGNSTDLKYQPTSPLPKIR